jgi:hypothetical protein
MSAAQREAVHNATVECARFMLAADRALARDGKQTIGAFYKTREMGAVKRASLDLAAALVVVRRAQR